MMSLVQGVNYLHNRALDGESAVLLHRNINCHTVLVNFSSGTCTLSDFSKAKEVRCEGKLDSNFDVYNYGATIDSFDILFPLSMFATDSDYDALTKPVVELGKPVLSPLKAVMEAWGIDPQFFNMRALKNMYYGVLSDLYSLAIIMSNLFPDIVADLFAFASSNPAYYRKPQLPGGVVSRIIDITRALYTNQIRYEGDLMSLSCIESAFLGIIAAEEARR